jgi:hypothetical protein
MPLEDKPQLKKEFFNCAVPADTIANNARVDALCCLRRLDFVVPESRPFGGAIVFACGSSRSAAHREVGANAHRAIAGL